MNSTLAFFSASDLIIVGIVGIVYIMAPLVILYIWYTKTNDALKNQETQNRLLAEIAEQLKKKNAD